MIGEEAIAVVDTDQDCAMSYDELLAFIEKWAKSKKTKITENDKYLVEKIFTYVDESKDGVIDPMELLPAIRQARKMKWLGKGFQFYYSKMGYLRAPPGKEGEAKEEPDKKKKKGWFS